MVLLDVVSVCLSRLLSACLRFLIHVRSTSLPLDSDPSEAIEGDLLKLYFMQTHRTLRAEHSMNWSLAWP